MANQANANRQRCANPSCGRFVAARQILCPGCQRAMQIVAPAAPAKKTHRVRTLLVAVAFLAIVGSCIALTVPLLKVAQGSAKETLAGALADKLPGPEAAEAEQVAEVAAEGVEVAEQSEADPAALALVAAQQAFAAGNRLEALSALWRMENLGFGSLEPEADALMWRIQRSYEASFPTMNDGRREPGGAWWQAALREVAGCPSASIRLGEIAETESAVAWYDVAGNEVWGRSDLRGAPVAIVTCGDGSEQVIVLLCANAAQVEEVELVEEHDNNDDKDDDDDKDDEDEPKKEPPDVNGEHEDACGNPDEAEKSPSKNDITDDAQATPEPPANEPPPAPNH